MIDDLTAELAALPTPASHGQAQTAANALRFKYKQRLDREATNGKWSDPLRLSISQQINDQIDKFVSDHAPIQDERSGWASRRF